MARTSAGVFGALGGDIVIKVDISPHPEQIRSQLMMAAHNLEDTMKPMLTARRAAIEDIKLHFETEHGPDGEHWAELDETYLRYKESKGMAADILKASGALEKAATSEEAFIVTAHGLWFNWDALPKVDHPESESGEGNLGIIHQRGTGGSVSTLTIDNPFHVPGTGSSPTSDVTVRSQKEGRGKNLPARPFVGMSQEMIPVFTEIFDVWFDEAVRVVINPKTGFMQHFEGGRFGGPVRF